MGNDATDGARSNRNIVRNSGATVGISARDTIQASGIPYAPSPAISLAVNDTVFRLPLRRRPASASASAKVVPDVEGFTLRAAVRTLHEAGFQVALSSGMGAGNATIPAAGSLAPAGTLIRLKHQK